MFNVIALLIVTGCNVAMLVLFVRTMRENRKGNEEWTALCKSWHHECDEWAVLYAQLRERYEERGGHDA